MTYENWIQTLVMTLIERLFTRRENLKQRFDKATDLPVKHSPMDMKQAQERPVQLGFHQPLSTPICHFWGWTDVPVFRWLGSITERDCHEFRAISYEGSHLSFPGQQTGLGISHCRKGLNINLTTVLRHWQQCPLRVKWVREHSSQGPEAQVLLPALLTFSDSLSPSGSLLPDVFKYDLGPDHFMGPSRIKLFYGWLSHKLSLRRAYFLRVYTLLPNLYYRFFFQKFSRYYLG